MDHPGPARISHTSHGAARDATRHPHTDAAPLGLVDSARRAVAAVNADVPLAEIGVRVALLRARGIDPADALRSE